MDRMEDWTKERDNGRLKIGGRWKQKIGRERKYVGTRNEDKYDGILENGGR